MNNRMTSTIPVWALGLLLGTLLAPGWQSAHANATDIAVVPIFAATPPTTEVKPNVLFVLDDSGSMDWEYMPDDVSNFRGKVGFVSSQCNGMYYNPAITYLPPLDASGNLFSDSSFTNAPNDGYGVQATGSTNLGSSFKAYSSDITQAAYYYTYSGAQTTQRQKDYYKTTSTFYIECNSAFTSTTATTLFHKVLVDATSGPGATDERTNFANWYTYYRTRMQMMKSAAGRAFNNDKLAQHFRVGFMTLNNNVSPDFLNISDFNPTQKSSFYTKLYSANPSNSTPLREALSRAGRLYAGKLTTLNGATVVDPVQYSCQQNYTILSTDGFWNGTDSSVKKIDGTTTMGNEDGVMSRPFYDGSNATTTIVTPYTSTQDRQTVTNISTITNTWTRTSTTIGASCTAAAPPTSTATAPMSVGNGRVGALGKKSTNPDFGRCYSLGNQAWFCRSGGSLATSASFITDTAGKTWYLVSDIGTKTGCVSSRTAFGSSYDSTDGVCPADNVAGNLVIATPQTQAETITDSSTTSLDQFTATQTTTQTITNGIAGPVGGLTPATPVYSLTSNISSSSVPGTDTCGGQPAPCPSTAGTWTTGTASSVCTASTALPSAGVSTPVISSTVTSGVSTNVTIVASSGPTAGTPTTNTVATGGIANTLADTAAYYYNTNLRTTALGNCTGPIIPPATTPTNLCATPGTVPPNGFDTATYQHMTTHTLGLGVRGRMIFTPNYLENAKNNIPGDFTDVFNGTNTNNTTNCTWRDTLTVTGGPCNWPKPASDAIENVDDLWHAAVNGRGNFYSATDPQDLANGLNSSINAIINVPVPGAAAASATSNPVITSSNNFKISSYFKTIEWSGELIRQTIDLTTGLTAVYDPGAPDPTTYDWSAQVLLDAKIYTGRNIFTKGSSGSLIPFTWADLVANGLDSNFKKPNITSAPPAFPDQISGLTQFCITGNCLSSTAQNNFTAATGGAAGEALVNFLRGDRSNEEGTTTDNTKFFRRRVHVLGDIVTAQAQIIVPPQMFYSDANYSAFASAQSSRPITVLSAANDGMLHSFDFATGNELWAYIPSKVLPRLYTLADKLYGAAHRYFVEGTPAWGDICPNAPGSTCSASQWKTIVVGGLNAGGTGYYALDITDTQNPRFLWEFSDPNMGLTFGKPQITKLENGTWVVLLSSGYNNCPRGGTAAQTGCVGNGTGDGKGYLYVVNAATGALITSISTGSGSMTAPSGFSRFTGYAPLNNVTTFVYGGDLNGDFWRFNISPGVNTAFLLAQFQDANGVGQPVMDVPMVTSVDNVPALFVGTGKYLGATDVGSKLPQSFYAVKDNLLNVGYGVLRTDPNNKFPLKTAVETTCPPGTNVLVCLPGQDVRTVAQTTGSANDSLANMNGWILDFPAGVGEIDFTDPQLVSGTLVFTTSVPFATSGEVCSPKSQTSDGLSFVYELGFMSGGPISSSNGVVGISLGTGMATAPNIFILPPAAVDPNQTGTTTTATRGQMRADGSTETVNVTSSTDGSQVKGSIVNSGGTSSTINVQVDAPRGSTKRVSWRELINP